MTPLFKKLNFKNHKEICILNAPAEFKDAQLAMNGLTNIVTELNEVSSIEFILSFVKTEQEIKQLATLIDKKLEGDGIVWFAYPKGTSKKYKVEINRDNGWLPLTKFDLIGVRAVAIDDDWSALRFRRKQYIKKLTRKNR